MNKKKLENSNRSFGLIFFIVLAIISFWSFRGDLNDIKIIPLIFSIVFLILGLLNSKFLAPLNKYWIRFGELLGKIISPIVMGVIYFLLITPISIIIRLFGKDLIGIKFSKMPSYWIKRQKNIGSMNKQF